MASETIPDDMTRSLLSGHVIRLHRAVHLQTSRVLMSEEHVDSFDDFGRAEIDAYLCAYTLRDLRLVCLAARPWAASNRIDAAVAAFDNAAPGIKDVRDIYAHIDAYESGTGNLQKNGTVDQPLHWLERGNNDAVLVVLPFRISLQTAKEAAGELAGTALEVLVP